MRYKPRSGKSDTGTFLNEQDLAHKKSNTELLQEIEEALRSGTAEDLNTDKIEQYLSILQERAPVMEDYDPEQQWNELQEAHPLIFAVEETPHEEKRRHRRRSPLHTLRLALAGLTMVVCFMVTANALGFNPVQSVITWAEGVIQTCFNPSGIMDLPEDTQSEYHSLKEALTANSMNADRLPTWVPKDYSLVDVTARQIDGMTKCTAVFESNRGELIMRVVAYSTKDIAVKKEREVSTGEEIFKYNGMEYYLISNDVWNKAEWHDGLMSFTLSGQISDEEIKEIIQSIK